MHTFTLSAVQLPPTPPILISTFLRMNPFCDPGFAKFSVVEGKGIKVDMSLDDIEEIQGFIAAEANHTENKKLQRDLDRLFDKLQVYLDTYDDQDE